ncbi:hypothetical protein FB565_007427 [Actinoplanes lutulentus]|uniref:Cutinase n=1 Tax=Actinoplanes lutulentus TaxID=1287878 RepID=A0A327Z0K6_9ACTN|nr:cutinase family protein [Actinoplanes lutulentus]MBB2947656.1 hypothetical protein [Actinoplanes lutulentus]RAK27712.1 Cutinase [Actinoplanes lutulentus]
MVTRRKRSGKGRRLALAGACAAVVAAGAVITPQAFAGTGFFGTTTAAGACSDVELVFARGTGEPQGLGIVGRPLARALAAELPDLEVGSFAVVYAAAGNQRSAGPGATNMSQHITSVAAACPETRFVIGGYSQGASVTDIGIRDSGRGYGR